MGQRAERIGRCTRLLARSTLFLGVVCAVVACSSSLTAWVRMVRASNHLPSISLGLVEGGGVYVGEMALVFNSGSLLAHEFGDEIDRHQYVLRINFAWPREDLTQYVGNRTTHVMFGPQETNKDILFNHTLSHPPRIDPITNSPTRLILTFTRPTIGEDAYFATRLASSQWNPHNQSVNIIPEQIRKEHCRKTFDLHSRNCTSELDGKCTCSSGALTLHDFNIDIFPQMLHYSVHKLSIFGLYQDCHYRYHWWDRQRYVGYRCNNTDYVRPEGFGYTNAVHDMAHEHRMIERLARTGRITIVS